MCLTSFGSRKKAKTDIVCFKIFRVYPKNDGLYIKSRIHNYRWEIGKAETCKRATSINYGEIHDGYFHSYTTVGEAMLQHGTSGSVPEYIFKCIIPAGTWYYEGIHSDHSHGYASKSLVVKELLMMESIQTIPMDMHLSN